MSKKRTRFCINVIVAFAPTTEKTKKTRTNLEKAMKEIKNKQLPFILGDFNAKVVGAHVVREYELGICNDKGQRLAELERKR